MRTVFLAFLALTPFAQKYLSYLYSGDELSVRAKFALITWVGPKVGALKKAKVSTDKAAVKLVCTNFAKEILADNISEVQYDLVVAELRKVGGANYGTGARDDGSDPYKS